MSDETGGVGPDRWPPPDDETAHWHRPAEPPVGPPPGQTGQGPGQPPPAPDPQWAPPQDPTRPWDQTLSSPPADPDPLGGRGAPSTVEEGSVRTGVPVGRIALVLTVLVVAGLGGFAVWRALDEPGGAATPEEAAAQLFDSAESEDLLGVIENMLPSERESMIEPMTDVMIELARLDIVADEAVEGDQPNVLNGLTIDIPDPGQPGELVYDVEPLGDSETVRWVTVTDGEMTLTFDPIAFRDGLGARMAEWIEAEMTAEDREVQTETIDLGEEYRFGEPLQFAVVEEGGSWFFSMWYTAAGFASDFEAPDPAQAPTPVGGDSPDDAAAQFLEALIELDMETAMTMLDPDEFRAAYDYWGRYGPDLAAEAADARAQAAAEGVRWELSSISVASEDRNGRTVATIDDVAIDLTSDVDGIAADLTIGLGRDGLRVDGLIQGGPIEIEVTGERATGRGSIEGDRFEFDIDLVSYEGFAQLGIDRFDLQRDGDCVVVTINGTDSETLCGDELGADAGLAFDVQEDLDQLLDDVGIPGLTVVERDDRWYVSGFPTYAYAAVDFLQAIDAEELDELITSYEDLLDELDQFDTDF